MQIYFGHPVNTYGTDDEQRLIGIIHREFPDYDIENPNQQKHQEGYKQFKEEYGNGMEYFYTQILPNMDAGVFLAFDDGMFGAGVYNEAQWIFNNGKQIYEINQNDDISDLLLTESRRLSVEETRSRVYK